MIKFIPESTVIHFGGKLDASKAVAPCAVEEQSGAVRLFYVGTNCRPEDRKYYRILSAESKDGVNFQKHERLVISVRDPEVKLYSPAVVDFKQQHLLYYSECLTGRYQIKVSQSLNPNKFPEGQLVTIDKLSDYSCHTPRLLADGEVLHGYFTASASTKKIYSKKYPQYEFAEGFKIWHGTSDDGKQFKDLAPIKIDSAVFENIYGHGLISDQSQIYLFFTGFDGSINKIYVTSSTDWINFSQPEVVITPDETAGELGIYSCSLVKLGGGLCRIYYGVRYFSNHWDIKSARVKL